jgi:hypothetical protein
MAIPDLAGRDTLCVLFLWALMVGMSTPTPQAMGRLPTLHADVAKILTIVALYKPVWDL